MIEQKMGFTFKGGVHPDYQKEFTASLAIAPMATPKKVVIPLQQHIGAPCEPLVTEGDTVVVGQKIGEGKGFVSAPVHASIAGKVTAIGPYNHSLGRMIPAVTIEAEDNGPENEPKPVQPAGRSLEEFTAADICAAVQEAGIVGLGGATFPTHVKLAPPPEKPIDVVVLNGAECEPYLTADHRLMLEQSEEIVSGLKLMLKALGATQGIIGIEANKPDALRVMAQAVEQEENLSVVSLQTKYPQGAEKMLIQVTTRRKVPAGGLPMDVGVVNHNVGTAIAIAQAVRDGRPLTERVVTVTGGGITRPANLMVKIGTLVSEVIDFCGGLKENACKLIIGGPMMGLAQIHADIPVIKGTSGITVLSDEEICIDEIRPCIKCAKCVEACPMNLLPLFLAQAAEHNQIDRAEKLHAADCFECGCCAYVCPARRPLTQWIRLGKAAVLERRRKQ